MADRTSRPWLSVPSRWAVLPPAFHAGGVKASMRLSDFTSNGLYGATQGAKIAAIKKSTVTMAAPTVVGDRRKLHHMSESRKRARVVVVSAIQLTLRRPASAPAALSTASTAAKGPNPSKPTQPIIAAPRDA